MMSSKYAVRAALVGLQVSIGSLLAAVSISSSGPLRAYAAKSGEIIWDVDTVKDYTTVNGAAGHGGSPDGPGAVVAGGMLYVNSGYTNYGTLPGNVLLAFSVDGK
jgi:polyvinyl alcohol dehydrogenase (cytochrome)